MALSDLYVSVEDLKKVLGVDHANHDERITWALQSSSRGIDKYCGRQFNKAGSVTQRIYKPASREVVKVDDFHTTTGLVVATDDDGDGVFETTWSASDYQLEPLNGIVDGDPGWPWWTLRAVGNRDFPCSSRGRATVRAAADWGWAAVPDPVREACQIVALETYKLPEAPFGVAGFAEFGVMRVRDNPMAKARLAPYQRNPYLAA